MTTLIKTGEGQYRIDISKGDNIDVYSYSKHVGGISCHKHTVYINAFCET